MIYKKNWTEMMCGKLGLFGGVDGDEGLINDLLLWMFKKKADFTNLFRSLMRDDLLDGVLLWLVTIPVNCV